MTTGGQPAGQPAGQQSGDAAAVPWSGVANGGTWEIGGKPWYETAIPEGPAREYAKTKRFAHPGVLASTAYEADRTIASRDDSKMIRIPDENATQADWDTVFTKLGRPASPDGYKDVKWGDDADPRMVEFAKGLAYKLGIPPKMAESVMAAEWNQFMARLAEDESKSTSAANEQALAELQTAWGSNFDGHRARGLQVMQALNKEGFSDADMAAVEKHIGITPVVKLLATIGKLSGEGSLLDSQGGGGGQTDVATMTPEQAKAEIAKLTTDDKFQKTYLTKTESGHAEALARMEALYKKAGALVSG